MLGAMIMLGGVLVLRRIAAANVSTFQAQPQMDPGIAGLDAVFADIGIRGFEFNLFHVAAALRHGFSFRPHQRLVLLSVQARPGPTLPQTRRPHKCFAEIPEQPRSASWRGVRLHASTEIRPVVDDKTRPQDALSVRQSPAALARRSNRTRRLSRRRRPATSLR